MSLRAQRRADSGRRNSSRRGTHPSSYRQLRFLELESRITPTTLVADYRTDFAQDGQLRPGWHYWWNAPAGWSPSSGITGDLSTRPVGEISAHGTPLAFVAGSSTPMWTATGSAATNHEPDGLLRFTPTGGATGRAVNEIPGNAFGRYAVAAYTVQEAGYFRIIDSFLNQIAPQGKGDRLDVRVAVNGGAPLASNTAAGTATINFDTSLGYLNVGDTIYVEFGPGGNSSLHSAFAMDFSIEIQPVVADYRRDFHPDGSLTTGWQYLWNAPSGWGAGKGGSGNMASGSIDDPGSYRPLTFIPGSTFIPPMWTPTGAWGLVHEPDGYLRLTGEGGHPGRPISASTGNAVPRFAIAAYSVQQSGNFRIIQSYVETLNSSIDGVELRVAVNGQVPLMDKLVEAGARGNFDLDLGYLNQGDTIYVAVSPKRSDTLDGFLMDFAVALTSTTESDPLADYQTGYSTAGDPNSRWSYYWNQPTGWDPNQTGNLTTGALTERTSWQQLQLDWATGSWTPTGIAGGTNPHPQGALNFSATGGSPGEAAAKGNQPRYAIAAYEIPESGYYAIANSAIHRADFSGASDGIEIQILADGDRANSAAIASLDRKFIGQILPNPADPVNSDFQTTDFNSGLGYLTRGAHVYVAFGPRGNDAHDAFTMNFDVLRILPRVEPLRDLQAELIVDVPAPGPNDTANVQVALDQATQLAKSTGQNVEVRFAPGVTYHLASAVPLANRLLLNLTDARNIVINGNHSNLVVTDPGSGVLLIGGCTNVVVKDFDSIDYSTLPFTQGFIHNINVAAKTFDYTLVEGRWPLPVSPAFLTALANGSCYGWAPARDALRNVIPGRVKYGTVTELAPIAIQAVAGGYRLQFASSAIFDNLSENDPFILEARYDAAPIFKVHSSALNSMSQQITFSHITAFAAPGHFVLSTYSEAVNVLDCEVVPGPPVPVVFEGDQGNGGEPSPTVPTPVGTTARWMSTDSDAVHVQSARVGPWIENSNFSGVGDDLTNVYTTTLGISAVSADRRTLTMTRLVAGQQSNFTGHHFRVGEDVTFVDSATGTVYGPLRITSFDVNTQRVTFDSPANFAITFVSAPTPTVAFNTDLAAGFVIQGNRYFDSRRYGVWVQSADGLIADNEFTGLGNSAITVTNKALDAEGIRADNLAILGNYFSDVGRSFNFQSLPEYSAAAAIDVHLSVWVNNGVAMSEPPATTNAYFANNIQIQGNRFDTWNKRAIGLRNVLQAFVVANQFEPGIDVGAIVTEARYDEAVTIKRNIIHLLPGQIRDVVDGTVAHYVYQDNHIYS